jgi:hypothetical protein
VRVTVEEPVAEDHLHPGLCDDVREPAPFVERVRGQIDVPEVDALEQFERQDPGARVAPVDPRDADVRMTREVAVELLRVAGFHPVVELLADRARELVHERDRVDELERLHALTHEPSDLVHELEVGFDLARCLGPLHLDGNPPSVRQRGSVHLADGGGCHRRLLEIEEELLDREAEVLPDDELGLHERKRCDVVLEGFELEDDVRRDNVRTR